MAVNRARKIERFLTQPFFVAAQFTGRDGEYVPVAETVRELPRDPRRRARRPARGGLLHEGLDRPGHEAPRRRARRTRASSARQAEARGRREEAESARRSRRLARGRREDTLEAQVLTPEGRCSAASCGSSRPGPTVGEVGILAGHAPMVARLRPGRAAPAHRPTREVERYAQGEGWLEVFANRATGADRRGDPARRARRRASSRSGSRRPSRASREAEEGSAAAEQAERERAALRGIHRDRRRQLIGAELQRTSARPRCAMLRQPRGSVPMEERLLTEKLIGYDTSTPEGIKHCAGFVKGWLDARDIETRQIDCPRPAGDARRGRPGRRADDAAAPRPHRRRPRARRSSSSPGVEGDRLLRPRRLRHEGRARRPCCWRWPTCASRQGPGAPRDRSRRGVRGGGRARRRPASSPRASSATSRSPASRPTCTSGSPPRGSLAMRMRVDGRAAHGATPWLGENAILQGDRGVPRDRVATVCVAAARSCSTGRRSTSAGSSAATR